MAVRHRWALVCGLILLVGLYRIVTADTAPAQIACQEGCGVDGCTCGDGTCTCQHCGEDCCVMVPDTKTTKKPVYSCKLVPYCKTKCPNPLKCKHDACETCPTCETKVRYKRVLLKREISTKTPICKCVPASEAAKMAAPAHSSLTPPRAYEPEVVPPAPPKAPLAGTASQFE